MRNNPLGEIVELTIRVSNPAVNRESFDNILLVVPAPASAGTESVAACFEVSSVNDLAAYGYTETEVAYIAVSAAMSQPASPRSVWLCVRRTIQESGGTADESIANTLARANDECSFYGFSITSYQTTAADAAAAAVWAEANDKLFALTYTDYSTDPLTIRSYDRTFEVFGGAADADEQPAINSYLGVGLMAECFSYTPGAETWHLRRLAGFVPSRLTPAQKTALEGKFVTTFRRYAGRDVSFGGQVVSGEWIDIIRFKDWLHAEISTNVFNALAGSSKVPFTDAGIGMIEAAVKNALMAGQTNGGIAPDEYDDDGTKTAGYTVSVPRIEELTEAQRKARTLPNVKFTARLAGAIHTTIIEGVVTF